MVAPGSRGSMPGFRYGVVEDEAVARKLLLQMLQRLAPDGECRWEAAEGGTALRLLQEKPVDVLFLDIVFPPDGAFRLLEQLSDHSQILPEIVFVTSRDDLAVKAFEWAACDYLVKPVTPARVQATLARLREDLRPTPDFEKLMAVVRDAAGSPVRDRFTAMVRDRIKVFRWSEVMYLHTEFRQVYARTAQDKVPLDQSMEELAALLADRFVRIHRSSLVNLDYVVEVYNPVARAGAVVMKDQQRLSVSRVRMDELLQRLGR